MYTKDLSKLIYAADIQEEFIFKLGVHHSTFSHGLKTGAVYLNKYIFTDKPVGSTISSMSEEDVKAMLDKDRLEELEAKNVTRKVRIRSADDNSVSKLFDTIVDCVAYLNDIAPSNKSTLKRRIETKKPYHGYYVEWESDERIPLGDKAIQVSVTDISTGKTETYSSMREAALSFAPEHITTGPTVKAYADSGKVFKCKYLITYSKG